MEDSITDKKNSVDFEEAFDFKPLQKGFVARIEESIFGLMRGRKKQVAQKSEYKMAINQPRLQKADEQKTNPIDGNPIIEKFANPLPHDKSYGVQNGLYIRKKTFIEKARDQLRFPDIKIVDTIISGCALLVFAVGAYILYSELPTKPELVVGIVLVVVAGNIITRSR